MISAELAVPSTPMEFVSRLTEQLATPGTLLTAFSTRAEQAAQLMPVTLYCSIKYHSYVEYARERASYFMSLGSRFISSSSFASLPARRSSATQVEMCWASSSLEKLFSAEFAAATCTRMSTQ